MKTIKFTIKQDCLRHGNFPKDRIIDVCNGLPINIDITKDRFTETVSISIDISDEEDELTTAYEFGALVTSINAGR